MSIIFNDNDITCRSCVHYESYHQYPIAKEVRVDFGNSSPTYREMTPEEYEKELNFYRLLAEAYSLSSGRLAREYGHYLQRWFSDGECDGYDSYKTRHHLHQLPQTANGYMFE